VLAFINKLQVGLIINTLRKGGKPSTDGFRIIAALSAKRRAANQGSAWAFRITTALVLIAVLALGKSGAFSSFKGYEGWVLWPQTWAVGLLACTVTAAGVAIAFWARATLGGKWSGNVELKENHELIRQGLYQHVRHPIYTGILVMALGTAIWVGRAEGFASLGVMFVWTQRRTGYNHRKQRRHAAQGLLENSDL